MNYTFELVVMAVVIFMVMREGLSRPTMVLEAIRLKKVRCFQIEIINTRLSSADSLFY